MVSLCLLLLKGNVLGSQSLMGQKCSHRVPMGDWIFQLTFCRLSSSLQPLQLTLRS